MLMIILLFVQYCRQKYSFRAYFKNSRWLIEILIDWLIDGLNDRLIDLAWSRLVAVCWSDALWWSRFESVSSSNTAGRIGPWSCDIRPTASLLHTVSCLSSELFRPRRCVHDAASTATPQQSGRRRLNCLKKTAVVELVAAGAAVSAEAPRFLAAFGPSVDGRTVRGADLRGRMSNRRSDEGGRRSVFSNVSLLVGLSVGDGLSRLTLTELDTSDDEAELNRKRRTLVRTFVQNLFTFHRQTIADILLHQV